MARRLPLSTLLSFALVAFTIEFDNEAEHRLPHQTTDFGGSPEAIWLVSLAMYFNCLQFIPKEGIAMRELERQARTRPNWDGMRRWRYVFFEPDPSDPRPRPPQSAWLVRLTANGRLAQKMMGSLLPEMEQRWRERFGAAVIEELRRWLIALVRTLPEGLPDCMPILRYGLVSEGADAKLGPPDRGEDVARLPLAVLLARVLVAFTLEFERESPVSLAICADILRVLSEEGTSFARIPGSAGVSKEGVTMAIRFLSKGGYVRVLSQKPAQRGRIVVLTDKGRAMQAGYPQQLHFLEGRWQARLDAPIFEGLRQCLEAIAGDGTREGSPLFQGLEPYPEGWRAKLPAPATLPHFPMVLHRGGYPDGS